MKPYLLFCHYYSTHSNMGMMPRGWYDFDGEYDTLKEAIRIGESYDWYHVVSTKTMEIVAEKPKPIKRDLTNVKEEVK